MAYGGWGGFNTGFPGYPSPFGDPGFGPPGGMLPPFLPPEAMKSQDSFERGGEKNDEKEESHGVSGFVKGMANGAVNMVKGMFSPQGLLMTAGVGALAWMTGGAILPVVGLIGLGTGAYQFMNGIGKGSAEAAGEGFFDLAFGMLGFAGPKSLSLNGEKFALQGGKAGEVAQDAGLLEKMKAPFGLSKYRNKAGDQELNLWELSGRKLNERFNGWFGNNSESAMARSATGDHYVSAPRPKGNSAMVLEDAHKAIEQISQTRSRDIKTICKDINKVILERDITELPEIDKRKLELLLNEAIMPKKSRYKEFMGQYQKHELKKDAIRKSWAKVFRPNWQAEVKGYENAQRELLHDFRNKHMKDIGYLMDQCGIDLREEVPAVFWEDGRPVNQFKTAGTGRPTEASEETVAAMMDNIEATDEQREVLEYLYQTDKLGDFNHHEMSEYKKLYQGLCSNKKNAEHAERLKDLWNLKIIKLLEKGPEHDQFAQFYDGDKSINLNERINEWGDARGTELGKLKLKALGRLNNSTKGDWILAGDDRVWLAKETTNTLYKKLPDPYKVFLPSEKDHKAMLAKIDSGKLEDMKAVQAYHTLLDNLYENNGLPSANRKEILDAYMNTQSKNTQSTTELVNSVRENLLKLNDPEKNNLKALQDKIQAKQNSLESSQYFWAPEVIEDQKTKLAECFETLKQVEKDDEIENLSEIHARLKELLGPDIVEESLLKRIQDEARLKKALQGPEGAQRQQIIQELLKPVEQRLILKNIKAGDLHGSDFQRAGLEFLLDQDKARDIVAMPQRWIHYPAYLKKKAGNWAAWLMDRSKPEYAKQAAQKRAAELDQDFFQNVLGHKVGLANSNDVQYARSTNPKKLFGAPKVEPKLEVSQNNATGWKPVKSGIYEKPSLLERFKKAIFGGSDAKPKQPTSRPAPERPSEQPKPPASSQGQNAAEQNQGTANPPPGSSQNQNAAEQDSMNA